MFDFSQLFLFLVSRAGILGLASGSSDSGLSRLKQPRPYPVAFSRIIFRLAGRMGDFSLTGRIMGESRVFGMMESLAFSFRRARRSLRVADRS